MVVFIQAELDGVTTDQYDALNAKLQAMPGIFEGCLSHAAVPTETGLKIFDLWESEEAMRRFGDAMMPVALEEGFPEGPMPQILPVHNYMVPGA